MTIIEERLAELDKLVLDSGGHDSWEKGACVMEAVAYVAGEPFSDHPACASQVITDFLISWNDALPDGRPADAEAVHPPHRRHPHDEEG